MMIVTMLLYLGDTPDAEGVQQDDVAVGQPADDIVIDGPEPAGVQVQLEASSIRRFSRATQGMTWAQVVQVKRPTRARKRGLHPNTRTS